MISLPQMILICNISFTREVVFPSVTKNFAILAWLYVKVARLTLNKLFNSSTETHLAIVQSTVGAMQLLAKILNIVKITTCYELLHS